MSRRRWSWISCPPIQSACHCFYYRLNIRHTICVSKSRNQFPSQARRQQRQGLKAHEFDHVIEDLSQVRVWQEIPMPTRTRREHRDVPELWRADCIRCNDGPTRRRCSRQPCVSWIERQWSRSNLVRMVIAGNCHRFRHPVCADAIQWPGIHGVLRGGFRWLCCRL